MNNRNFYLYSAHWLSVLVVLAVIFAGCRDSLSDLTGQPGEAEGLITVTGTLNMPKMPLVNSRGSMGDLPGSDLKLTLIEFDRTYIDGKPNAASSYLTNIYHAELKPSDGTNGDEVKFTVTLKASTSPKVLHFVIAGDYISTGFGSEASIIPNLTVNESLSTDDPIEMMGSARSDGVGEEAYWGKVEFPEGYSTLEADGTITPDSDLESALKSVSVIRNFAKISVSVADVIKDNFGIIGFELINVPTSGTIAPWKRSDLSIPSLLSGHSMKDYSDIVNVDGYTGVLPDNVIFRNTEVEARSWTNMHAWSPVSRYIYEHPFEADRRTYIILFAVFKDDSGSWNQGYYKIDIGKTTETTDAVAVDDVKILSFDYYNIIRNIDYNIVINNVTAPGVSTVSEAILRAPFNHISTSTETSLVPSMSDGNNLIIVNDINHIVVEDNKEIKVLYRYIKNINGGNRVVDNDVPRAIGLVPGTVIKSVSGPVAFRDPSQEEWMEYTILCNNPTDITRIQEFTIVDNNGLGRTISLVLRKPWTYSPIIADGKRYSATVAAGHADSYQGAPQDISDASGQELTVYFNLPDGMPRSIFPLEFRLESKIQGIENNKMGSLVVTSGPSLFEDKKGQITISYIKSLSYEEYYYNYLPDSNDIDINSYNSNHTVRCRFTTISNVASGTEAEIRIHNDYFTPDADVKFKRVNNP